MEREPIDVSLALASYVLGLLAPEKLPEWAVAALMKGLESPSLAALAGESPRATPPDELRDLFSEALRDLGLALPTPVEAAQRLVRHYAANVSSGSLSPRAGA